MCGIVSYFSNEKLPNKQMSMLMYNALWIDSIRGDHSTGIIYELDGEVDYYKKAMPGYDFCQLPLPQAILSDLGETRYLIGHNRAATMGDKNHANAHPFECDHLLGVHNGTLSNHHTLLSGGNYPVDSHRLYAAMARDGADVVLPKVNGSFNLIWHDYSDNTIHMVRNDDRPYTFAKIRDQKTLIGMSEKAMLKWLIGRHGFEIEYCWTPKKMVEYVFNPDGDDITQPCEIIKHKEYKPPAPVKSVEQQTNRATDLTNNTAHDKKIEFFMDSLVPNLHLVNGKKTGTYYGETLAGEEVVVSQVEEGELQLDTWYIGTGFWCSGGQGHYKCFIDTIKPHPLEEGEGTLHICVNCGEDFPEPSVVYVDNAPLCIQCCQSFNVAPGDCDAGEGWKLMSS